MRAVSISERIHDEPGTGSDRGVPDRTTHTYRCASRRVRVLERGGIRSRELADLVHVRDRAYATLLAAGHDTLARALVEEDAFVLRLQACRELGGEHTDATTELRSGLTRVRARIRVLADRTGPEGFGV